MKNIKTRSLATLVFLILLYPETHAQSAAAVQKKIEQANKQFVKWFNAGEADSIVAQYHPDACITDRGCGKTFLQNYYETETTKYSFKELTTLTVTVNDNVATETGQWRIQLSNSTELSGKYRTEWQRLDNRWVIFKETVLQ